VRATNLDEIAIWEGHDVMPAEFLAQGKEGLQLAAVPIIMGNEERLGALLIARSEPPFGSGELRLLDRAEDHIDSAVIQGYARHQHQQHVKELAAIYRLDQIRDRDLPFTEMLDAVLQEVLNTIEAEMGFVMLYDRSGNQLEVRAATPHNLFEVTPYYEAIDQVANEALDRAELLYRDYPSGRLRSVMCLPLILNEEIIGVLGAINRLGARSFASADRHLLRAIGSQADTAIFEIREKRQLRKVLGRSVDPRVMERLLANPNMDILKGERLELTVLYADIRGSTSLAERTEPESLVGFINAYLGQMTDVILSYEGTLDKFVGDEVMALFGAPFPLKDHALRAVRVGMDMLAKHQTIMRQWQDRGIETAPIGVGIATGDLIVGEMGCPQRTDYTVIGRAANLGSRICGIAKGHQLLISQSTYDLVKDSVEAIALPNQHFKGVADDVTVYHITRVLS
jgi:adenylate cyclase